MPSAKSKATKRITMKDVQEGRAYVRWPLHARLNLLHWAGAPWADRNPEAFLHALQVEVLARRERELILHGASRLGKSVLGGCFIILGLHTIGSKVACFSWRWDHVAHEWGYAHTGMKELYRGYPGALPRNIYRNQGNNQQYHIKCAWGSWGKGASLSADDGAAALGHEFTHVILGEGSHISPWLRDRVIQRALDSSLSNQKFPREDLGILVIATTPKAFEGCAAHRVDMIRREYGNQWALNYGLVPWEDTCWIREASLLENPAFPREVLESARKKLDPAAFQEQFLGLMTFRSGRVYAEHTDLDEVLDPTPGQLQRMRLALGIDTGAYFGCTLVGLDPDLKLWTLAEVYTQKRDIDFSCEQVRNTMVHYWKLVTGEHTTWEILSKRIKFMYVDPASQHKTELKNRLGMTPRHPMSEGEWELLTTIDQLRAKMREGNFVIAKRCRWTIDQIRKYIWKEQKEPGSDQTRAKEPRKIYDHLLDATRIAAVPLLRKGALPEPQQLITVDDALKHQRQEMVHGGLRQDMELGERMQRRQSEAFDVW